MLIFSPILYTEKGINQTRKVEGHKLTPEKPPISYLIIVDTLLHLQQTM